MPELMTYLHRFRRLVVPPGGLPPPTTPLEEAEALATELGPLLAEVDQIDEAAAAIEADGRTEADRLREAAERDAAAVLSDARERVAEARVTAQRERMRTHQHESHDLIAAAEREAERIRRAAAERMPALAEAVLDVLAGPPGGVPSSDDAHGR